MSTNWLTRTGSWTDKLTLLQSRSARRIAGVVAVSALVSVVIWTNSILVSPVNAQDVTYFRIATGGPGSQSFEIAGDISKAISNPANSECDASENCGVPGVIGMAQTTSGALESLKLLSQGQVEGAIVQADMAAMAAAGKGPFKSVGPDSNLRAIATVGDTALQVIVPDKSAIRSFADLKGKRIGISAIEADGTISVNQILTALGVVGKKTKLVPLSVADAAAGLVSGNLDAIAIMDRVNLPEITGISDHMAVRLISISVADSEKIGTDRHDFILAHLPVGTDHSATPIDTLIVPILFVVTAKTEESVAFDLARTLVVPKRGTKTTANPAASSPGAHIESTVIPLHSGVQRLLNSTN